MKTVNQLFLEALKASLENRKLTWDFELSDDSWRSFFALAESHKVLPMIFDAVCRCPSARRADPQLMQEMKQRSIAGMMHQIRKTSEFLNIYRQFAFHGIQPLVVKGLICRELYPNPDFRISSDEDILVPAEQFEKSIQILQECGLHPTIERTDVENLDEIGFIAKEGVSYIELHKSLFPKDSDAYGDLNNYFVDCFENAPSLKVQGTEIRTLEPTMHLFYLICHAFKHFLHSGFGLRQVCDITMFANAYGKEIDWQMLFNQCREIRADKFMAALFKIGKKYLTFDFAKACYSKQWQEIEIDEEELLLELLQSGIYGGSSMSRRHSAKMTLEAAASMKKGKKRGNTVLSMVFPPAKTLESRYTYLKERPYLLPLAWTSRILKYQKETKTIANNSVAETIKIGNERIELLKRYGIIE